MKLLYDRNKNCQQCNGYMKCDMNQIGLGSGKWARECILYKKGDMDMYYCDKCGGEDFVYVTNQHGEEVEECTTCGEQYVLNEDDDGGEEDD